jgi:hypothetical protein
MGVIAPKKRSAVSKLLFAALLIVFSPLLILAVLLDFLWGVSLYLLIWLTWRKEMVLFVYSNSPIWKEYIETEILPHIRDRAVILNWSHRKTWRSSLPVFAFRYFGGHRNFNPIGMVFRPFQRVKTYRFFEAFKEFKHGDAERVEELQKSFFETLDIFL